MDMTLIPLFRRIGPHATGSGKARWSAALLASFLLLAGCDSTTPEEKLKATIAQMQADGEAHEVGDVMDSVAEDFGGPGGMDRKQLHAMLTVVSLRNKEIGTTIGPIDVELV